MQLQLGKLPTCNSKIPTKIVITSKSFIFQYFYIRVYQVLFICADSLQYGLRIRSESSAELPSIMEWRTLRELVYFYWSDRNQNVSIIEKVKFLSKEIKYSTE